MLQKSVFAAAIASVQVTRDISVPRGGAEIYRDLPVSLPSNSLLQIAHVFRLSRGPLSDLTRNSYAVLTIQSSSLKVGSAEPSTGTVVNQFQ